MRTKIHHFPIGNETPPPPPKPGRGTCNSQHAGLLLDPMETSENDKEDTLDNSTDKENTEAGKKNFATKDPKNKHRGIKNLRSTREISTSRGTITIRTQCSEISHQKKKLQMLVVYRGVQTTKGI